VHAALEGSPAFHADPTPKVLLDTDLVIRAVNPTYARATARTAEELVSLDMFEAFPDNPNDPSADGVAKLTASLETVLRTGAMHHMVIQRYDVPDMGHPGQFLLRHWVPVNSPMLVDGDLVGVVHQVHDVTPLRSDVARAMGYYRDLLAGQQIGGPEAGNPDDIVRAFTNAIANFNELAEEVVNLKEALVSRATIDQAKGILMATHRCTADGAFDILRQLSNDTNVRLADVAAALVHETTEPA
jgi:hypothetical protein